VPGPLNATLREYRTRRRTSGPPGPLETAVSLLAHAAMPSQHAQVPAVMERYGLIGTGEPPISSSEAARRHGLPVSTMTGIVDRVRIFAHHTPPPPSLLACLELLQHNRYPSPMHASVALLQAGHTSGLVHPESLRQLAALHRLR